MRRIGTVLVVAAALALPARAHAASTLRGSPGSMERQHAVAVKNDYTFLRTPAQVKDFVEKGYLVPVEGNADYVVASGVSFPYARPELRTFVERLGAQYREGCGERLVVTSLTRPLVNQPANAHQLSVHPTGMAVDFRISERAACRSWLEGTLLALEDRGVLDVTRERNPPHYHVAVFTGAYSAYVEKLEAKAAAKAEVPEVASAFVSESGAAPAQETTKEERGSHPLRSLASVVLGTGVVLGLERRRKR
jgi:hypothetical protein